jgi:hypothetical protein
MTQEISPFDLNEQEEAKALRADATRLQTQIEVDDLKFVMGHKQGRRYVWRQLEKHGVFRSSFSSDPLLMAFKEGARNDGLKLMAEILEHCPKQYAEMLKEHKEHGKRRNVGDSRSGT